jgi:hybrid cluster-associated redox disulfide protein
MAKQIVKKATDSKAPAKAAETRVSAKSAPAQQISKDMQIGAILQKFPGTAAIMMNRGLHCIGCHVAMWETIEEGSRAHGMSDKDIDDMIKEMNALAQKQ